MQTKFLLLATAFLLLGSTPLALGQTLVQETERSMALGSRPCFRLDFDKAEKGLVEKLWRQFVKEQFDGKLKKDKRMEESSALGLESSIVSGDKFDLYSRVETFGGDGASLLVWFDVGSAFLNRRDHPERTTTTVDALRQFYFNVRREVIRKELDAEQDKLEALEKKLRGLKKDNENLEKDIEEYKNKIKKAEEDIVRNNHEQTKSQSEIENQQRTVEDVRRRMENVEGGGN